jgi:hypothetical protein
MTEKKKPGRKPRKMEESTINATINSVHEAEARRQAREDVVAARALDAEARRQAREDAVEARRQAREDTLAERRLAHDLRRMEAAETMLSRFSANVVGVARDGIHAMMPLYEHLGSEGTKEVILAQQESNKHAMDLLTTVLVEGVPAAIRAYAEVRSASKPAPVTHEDFATWTTTLMEHVYARNEAHLDLLDATTRNVSSDSSGNRTQEAALSVLKDFLKHDDCDHADDDNDDDDDDDDGYLMGGFGGLKDDYTPPMPRRAGASGDDFLASFKSSARPPSASVDGKDVIVAVEDGVKVAFDSSFTDELELATGSASGAITLSIYGEYDPGNFGIKPLGTVRLDMHDDALAALADFIGCILPEGGDATFRVEVESGDTMLLVCTFSVKVIAE